MQYTGIIILDIEPAEVKDRYKIHFFGSRCISQGEDNVISKERERILNTYKDAKVFLKKNARPLDEIKHLIGE